MADCAGLAVNFITTLSNKAVPTFLSSCFALNTLPGLFLQDISRKSFFLVKKAAVKTFWA
jgi:hypothetical protein